MQESIEIFIIYAREDKALCQEIVTQLGAMKRQSLIKVWHDRNISPGKEWKREIDQHLDSAQIILLLISPYFMSSNYCYSKEMMRAMERHECGEARVIPTILRPVEWKTAPFSELQALPTDGKPVTSWSHRDQAFLDITRGIRKVVEDLTVSSTVHDPSSSYQSLVISPPPTDHSTIQQREPVVREVYTQLTQPIITALALTGMPGVGKSTLAALVFQYAEKERQAGRGPFAAEPIWIRVNESVTMADLAGELFEIFGNSARKFRSHPLGSNAAALFNVLDTTDKPRLIILDQFDELLDLHTGQALDRSGIGVWLNVLNSQSYACRVLLTTPSLPKGTFNFSLIRVQEYLVTGLELAEGADLLQKQQIEASEAKLRKAVESCNGHPFALTLLASLLKLHKWSLDTFFSDPEFRHYWTGNIAKNILGAIYNRHLDQVQKKLLLAFSVYREPVRLDAARGVMNMGTNDQKLQQAHDAVLALHLLQAIGEGRYQLHPIVGDFAKQQANKRTLQRAHAKAAQYYRQLASKPFQQPGQQQGLKGVHPLIEEIWQLIQARQWQEAYDLMNRNELFPALRRWGDNATLLELYQLFLGAEKWQPKLSHKAEMYVNIGSIFRTLGQKTLALECYDQALNLYQGIGIPVGRRGEAVARSGIGRVYADLGQKRKAEVYCQRALELMREEGDFKGEGRVLIDLGRIYGALGQKQQALTYYHDALRIMQEHGDREGEGKVWNQLSRVYRALEEHLRALECSNKALKILEEADDPAEKGRTLSNLSRVHCAMGNYKESLECCEKALGILKDTGDRGWEGKTLSNQALAYSKLPEGRGEALNIYEKALHILFEEVEDRGTAAGTLNRLGRYYTDCGQAEAALEHYRQALDLYRKLEDRWEQGTTLNNIGFLHLTLKKHYYLALRCFTQAERIFTELGSPDHKTTREYISRLRNEVGETQFSRWQLEMSSPSESEGNQIVDDTVLFEESTS